MSLIATFLHAPSPLQIVPVLFHDAFSFGCACFVFGCLKAEHRPSSYNRGVKNTSSSGIRTEKLFFSGFRIVAVLHTKFRRMALFFL